MTIRGYGVPEGTARPDYATYAGSTSATGGFLRPVQPPPDDDQELDVDVQQTVSGITGIELNLVRPRWQRKSPPQPEVDVNWIAVGVTTTTASYRPAVMHVGDSGGCDVLIQQEELTALLSFYGPSAAGYAKLLRDGLQIEQNRDAMRLLGLSLVETGRMTTLPAAVGQLWQRRVDLELTLRRELVRTYPVRNLAGADGTIVAEVQDVRSGEPQRATTPWSADDASS